MLNPFPELLMFTFLAPTVLRIAAGGVLLAFASAHRARQREIYPLFSPLFGKLSEPLLWVIILVETTVAIMLFLGWYAQIAAIAGALVAVSSLLLRPRALSPFSRSTDWLLLAICLSLLLTGAGAFAFDLPL